jgi:XTP/dITP diphosphohydrolase
VADRPASALDDAVEVMDRLRSPGGCPWDAAQSHRSLAPFLLEEAYEVLDAIDTGDDAALRDELGDLLMQVLFHARLAEENASDPWSIEEVAAGLVEKLRRRHPHVFGDLTVDGRHRSL